MKQLDKHRKNSKRRFPRVLLIKFDKPPGGVNHLSYSEPIGLCYIAAYLRSNGVECKITHLFCDNGYKALEKVLLDYQPGIVGFSVRNFNLPMTVEVIGKIKNAFPEVKIALGGECITRQNAVDIAREADADVVVIGEGEYSFFEYVSSNNPATISGIAYQTTEGEFMLSQVEPFNLEPTELPMMAREGLPMNLYTQEGFPGLRYATMHTQRGCRYRCTFCTTGSFYKSVCSRSVEQILTEIDHLVSNYGTQALAIWDEDFFADLDRVQGIVSGLLERGSPVQWHTFMKITDLERPRLIELLPDLRKSGYRRSVVGIESFNAETLRGYQKKGFVDPVELLRHLTKNDILLCPTVIIGAPHQTCEDIRNELNVLISLYRDQHIKMDLPYVAFPTPFPGTKMTDELEKKGKIIDFDWTKYDAEHVVVASQCSPEELVELRDDFYRRFYE